MQGLLADYLPDWLPDDPNKKEAMRNGLLNFGAALMGGRGNLGEILGGGLMAGSKGYSGSLAQQQAAALQQAQFDQTKLENQKLQGQIDEPMQLAKIMQGTGAAGGIAPVAALPQIGATPAPQAAPATANPADLFQTYMGYGDRLTQAGKPAAAKQYYDLAEKLKPKVKETRALTVDGKRVMANVFEDGTTKALDGFAPDLEKLNFQNTGGSVDGLDAYTGQRISSVKATQSPDSIASNATQMRGQNMADKRAEDANKTSKLPQGYRWTADGAALEPIPGGPVKRAVSDQQQKVTDAKSVVDLLDMAQPLVSQATSSYGGAAGDAIARAFGNSTEGAQAAAQLKAIEGMLVSKMPKMSGPQSDKDVLLYRQMAGQIGDQTIPADTKKAAMKTIRQISMKYLEDNGAAPKPKTVAQLPQKPKAGGIPTGWTVQEH